jgi:hypothetical protein
MFVTLGDIDPADNCGVASVTNNAPITFPVGETIVTYTVIDIHGNSTTATQLVTVTDDEAPSITAPATVTVNVDAGSCEAANVSLGTPDTDDNCGIESTENDAPDTFPVGETTVIWTVTDIHGNTSTAEQLVTVVDNQTPSITAPSAITTTVDEGSCEATGLSLGEPVTADNCEGELVIENNAPETFTVGTTTVIWTVTDVNGNTATAAQIVTISDNQAPTISAPADIETDADENACVASAVDLGVPETADNCEVESVENDAPATFPVGETTVTWTVTDVNGNVTTATQLVTVHASIYNHTEVTACDSYDWAYNGLTYTESGNYTVNGVTSCSFEVLDLTIITTTYNATDAEGCDSYIWDYNGETYDQSGQYTVAGQADCSWEVLNLTIKHSTTSYSTEDTCGTYFWNDVEYTESGIYTAILTNAEGCDSVAVLDLFLRPALSTDPAVVTQTLVSNECGARVYRYTASGPAYALAYTWVLPATFQGGAVTVDSGDVNSSHSILVRISSNAATDGSDLFTVTPYNVCSVGYTESYPMVINALTPPTAPSISPVVVNSTACGGRIMRFVASAPRSATLATAASTGYSWTLPAGAIGATCVLDSGDLSGPNARVIRVRFLSNAAASLDTVKVSYTSNCGISDPGSYNILLSAVNPPVAPVSITAVTEVSNACGERVVRYEAPALTSATATTPAATGYSWTLPTGAIGSTCQLLSGTLNGTNNQIIKVKYTSNAAASGDTVKVSYASDCGLSAPASVLVNLGVLNPPSAPTVTATTEVSNVCGGRVVRYEASAPSSGSASTSPSSGYSWTLPTGTIGSTCQLVYGSLNGTNNQIIKIRYYSNEASSLDTVKVSYTSGCGNSTPARSVVTLAALNPPAVSPTITVQNVVTSVCGERVVRYVASAPVSGTTNNSASQGYSWVLPAGAIGSTCILDSGSLSGANAQVIRIKYISNAAASGDTVKVAYTSDCGNSPVGRVTVNLIALNPPAAPSITATTLVSSICSGRTVLYEASALTSATATTVAATGYSWTLPTGAMGATCVLDSGSLSGRVIKVRYYSNSASSGDTVKVAYTSYCGYSEVARSVVVFGALNPPAAPTVSATNVITNVCGGRVVRYTASTSSSSLATGYSWTLPTGAIGSTCVLDSGSLTGSGARVIKIRYISNAAASLDTVKVSYTSDCGNSSPARSVVSLTAFNPPSAPGSVSIAIVKDSCGYRIYRYTAPALPTASTTNAAGTGWDWSFVGNLYATAVVDSGSLTSRVVRIRYSNNAGAAAGDSAKVRFNSDCGYSSWKAQKLSNISKSCPATIAKAAPTATKTSGDGMDAVIFPNPTGSTLKLQVKSAEINGLIHVRILDLQGREYSREVMMPSETLTLGSGLKAGSYAIELRQGKKTKVLHLTKL